MLQGTVHCVIFYRKKHHSQRNGEYVIELKQVKNLSLKMETRRFAKNDKIYARSIQLQKRGALKRNDTGTLSAQVLIQSRKQKVGTKLASKEEVKGARMLINDLRATELPTALASSHGLGSYPSFFMKVWHMKICVHLISVSCELSQTVFTDFFSSPAMEVFPVHVLHLSQNRDLRIFHPDQSSECNNVCERR